MAILHKLAVFLVISAVASTHTHAHAAEDTSDSAPQQQLRRGLGWTCAVDAFSCKQNWQCCSGFCDHHSGQYSVGLCKTAQ
jgi:hypothetical protein